MFSSLVNQLTALLPKPFLFGSFLPALIFTTINLTLFYLHSAWFRDFVKPQISGAQSVAFYSTSAVLSVFIFAYVLSAVSGHISEWIEGQYWWPSFLKRMLCAHQRSILDGLQDRFQEARDERTKVTALKDSWRNALAEAASIGAEEHAGHVADALKPARDLGEKILSALEGRPDPVGIDAVNILFYRRATGQQVSSDAIDAAVNGLVHLLRENDRTAQDGDRLWQAQRALLHVIDYASDDWAARERDSFVQRETQFSRFDLAPTRLGNIAKSLQSYTFTRYKMNLDTFWGRLQVNLQKQNNIYSGILDAKAQLDFFVTSAWLTGLTGLFWFILLLGWSTAWRTMAIIAIVTPTLAALFYNGALTAAVAYGQVVRSIIDLNRLQLLRSLSIPLPAGIRDERATWERLQMMSTFGYDYVEMSYDYTQSN